ncbi:MAG TPA: insulinase family protein, partial [Longimicrobiaceae bacterium]
PELMAVVAVGDFDGERMETMIRERFGDIPRREGPERREFDVPDHEETIVSVATDTEATSATISVNMKREPTDWTTVGAYRHWILETLASAMMTNRLSEWTQKPNSPFLDVSSFQGRFLRPVSAFVLTARVQPNGVVRGLEELLREITRVRQHGFTRSELAREKLELMRRAEQRYAERHRTTSSGYAAEYTSHFLYGGTFVSIEDEYDLYRRIVPEITLSMVNGVARDWMRADNRVILVNMPEADSIRPPRQARLEALVRAVDGRRTTPFADSTSASPLMRTLPPPGSLASERVDEEAGVIEWVLGNGVRVLVKPTDFREDEVLLVARSPGGRSLLPDEDFAAALTAAAVVQAGGVGELSQVELRKRLAGTVAGVGADISEAFEGLSGAASARDVETLLQLVHLKFTAPRRDSAAIEAYRQQARSTLTLRSANPEQVFADSIRVLLTGNHPRARLPAPSDFERLDIDRSFEIYRERFADASDFTFYLVGSFDVDSLRALVVRYLGSLPSLDRPEEPRDVGIRPPEGVVRSTVRKGIEPKARTQLVFSGPVDFSRERLFELNVLTGILRIRLRESLREEMSGTYGATVGGGAVGRPRPRFQLAIGFGGEPDRMAELTRATFAVIDSLRTHGPTPDDLVKVREMELRERETDLRTNRFWIEAMLSYDQQGWPLQDILDYPEWLARVDAAAVRDYALRYLDPDRHVQVTLLPEREFSEGSAMRQEDAPGAELRR